MTDVTISEQQFIMKAVLPPIPTDFDARRRFTVFQEKRRVFSKIQRIFFEFVIDNLSQFSLSHV